MGSPPQAKSNGINRHPPATREEMPLSTVDDCITPGLRTGVAGFSHKRSPGKRMEKAVLPGLLHYLSKSNGISGSTSSDSTKPICPLAAITCR